MFAQDTTTLRPTTQSLAGELTGPLNFASFAC